MARARARIPKSLENFVRSDWEAVICAATLGVEDTRIAELYFLDAIPQVDIGTELGLSRSAVSKRLIKITERLVRTKRKLSL